MHFHIWDKWEVKERGDVKRTGTDSKIGKYIMQERRCIDCGLTQISEQFT